MAMEDEWRKDHTPARPRQPVRDVPLDHFDRADDHDPDELVGCLRHRVIQRATRAGKRPRATMRREHNGPRASKGPMAQHIVTCKIQVGGDLGTVVVRGRSRPVPYPEIAVLRHLHGETNVFDVEVLGLVARSAGSVEKNRMATIYGKDPSSMSTQAGDYEHRLVCGGRRARVPARSPTPRRVRTCRSSPCKTKPRASANPPARARRSKRCPACSNAGWRPLSELRYALLGETRQSLNPAQEPPPARPRFTTIC